MDAEVFKECLTLKVVLYFIVMCLDVKLTRDAFSCLVFVVNLTQLRVTCVEEISSEELLGSDWSVGLILTAGWWKRVQLTVRRTVSRQVCLECIRKFKEPGGGGTRL